jgi:hypothetical protein
MYFILALIMSMVVTYYLLKHEDKEPIDAVLLGTVFGLLWPFIILVGILVLIDDEEKTNEDPN